SEITCSSFSIALVLFSYMKNSLFVIPAELILYAKRYSLMKNVSGLSPYACSQKIQSSFALSSSLNLYFSTISLENKAQCIGMEKGLSHFSKISSWLKYFSSRIQCGGRTVLVVLSNL